MIIQVTQNDIDTGQRKHCVKCPVAKAIKRVIKKNLTVEVTNTCVSILYPISNSAQVTRPLCFGATRFIMDFDDRKVVEPFEFDLAIPEKYLAN